ncbi:MAG: SDR family NAD(P)-dependent oxidoreductase [Bacteroidota bacterium]
MKRLAGKSAIVTGGSKGIGKAIAFALGSEGANLIVTARTRKDLDATVEEFKKSGLSARGIPCDISSEPEVNSLIESAVSSLGKIDILVNNAGMGVFKPVAEMTVQDFDTMWGVNMRGVFLATHAVLPHMIKASAGHVVNISSLAGKNSFKGGAGYCATKWALRGFANSLMLEVRDHNIRVVTVFPGSVDTSFSSGGKKGKNITQPEDVAEAVVFAVTAPQRSMFSEIDVRPTRP